MSYHDYKTENYNRVINEYIGNSNYDKDYLHELSKDLPKTKNLEEKSLQIDEIIKKRNEIEKTRPRYSSLEDISTLEFMDYPNNRNEDPSEHQFLSVTRNLISEVELQDLKEIMVTLDEYFSEWGDISDSDSDMITELKKCMKSLVRIVHRFQYSREHFLPIEETHQSRKSGTVY